MSSNKKAREELERRYGAECFIEKLHLRKDDKPRKYTSKGQYKRMKQLSYHHIKMKKDGGETTMENGAILSNENYIWFHNQSSQTQGYMNAIFQEYKRQMDACREPLTGQDVPFNIAQVEFYIDERGKYNRAKKKQEDRKLIDKYYEEEDR